MNSLRAAFHIRPLSPDGLPCPGLSAPRTLLYEADDCSRPGLALFSGFVLQRPAQECRAVQIQFLRGLIHSLGHRLRYPDAQEDPVAPPRGSSAFFPAAAHPWIGLTEFNTFAKLFLENLFRGGKQGRAWSAFERPDSDRMLV